MPETKAVVTGVESGVALESVGFFASILVPMDLPAYSFKAFEIKHSEKARARPNLTSSMAVTSPIGFLSRLKGFISGKEPAQKADVESARRNSGSPDAAAPDTEGNVEIRGIRRQNTFREKVENTLVSGGRNKRPAIPAKLYSPLHMLTLFSFLISVAILVCAVIWRDGTAIISISLISLASSIVSYSTWWEPRLMSVEGTENRRLPVGDIIIRTREGAFIYVRCKEDVARELFSGTEECKYRVNGVGHNLLMATGTVILMLAIVLLGNCKWNSQMFIGASYVVLNGLYWGLGMLPKKYFWDMSRYEVNEITPPDARDAHKPTTPPGYRRDRSFTSRVNTTFSRVGSAIAHPGQPLPERTIRRPPPLVDPESRACFTRTLWYAIRESRSAEWVAKNKAAPNTDVWHRWLAEAEVAARKGDRGWRAVQRKDELIEEAQKKKERQRERDLEEERARASAIQEKEKPRERAPTIMEET